MQIVLRNVPQTVRGTVSADNIMLLQYYHSSYQLENALTCFNVKFIKRLSVINYILPFCGFDSCRSVIDHPPSLVGGIQVLTIPLRMVINNSDLILSNMFYKIFISLIKKYHNDKRCNMI